MKKLLVWVFVGVIMLVSSVGFFGCNKSGNPTDSPEKDKKEYSISAIYPISSSEVSLCSNEISYWLDGYSVGQNTVYYGSSKCFAKSVVFTWSCNVGADNYIVRLSLSANLNNYAEYQTKNKHLTVSELLVAKTYYWQVTAVIGDEEINSDVYSFKTEQTPRTISIDGVTNTRDIGGYVTNDGTKRVKQGMIYRGANADGITEQGKQKAINVYGINTDFDLRRPTDSEWVGVKSPIGNSVNYINIKGVHYETGDEYFASETNKTALVNEIKVFANQDNYPIFVHCSAGRDRTGTISYLINALLGVGEIDLYKDFELTFFSDGWDPTKYIGLIKDLNALINGYNGGSFKEKTENFLLSRGVTEADINSIRQIMLENI